MLGPLYYDSEPEDQLTRYRTLADYANFCAETPFKLQICLGDADSSLQEASSPDK